MDKTELSVLARNVAKGRWFVVFVCFLIMSLAGGTYIFGIDLEAINVGVGNKPDPDRRWTAPRGASRRS
ncbi:hypothetical protein SUGI_0479380 [Cryptomeria japonica]|nr:hypothetical protein SUGI_0479380 [Cryptomeria japonica]